MDSRDDRRREDRPAGEERAEFISHQFDVPGTRSRAEVSPRPRRTSGSSGPLNPGHPHRSSDASSASSTAHAARTSPSRNDATADVARYPPRTPVERHCLPDVRRTRLAAPTCLRYGFRGSGTASCGQPFRKTPLLTVLLAPCSTLCGTTALCHLSLRVQVADPSQ